METIEVSFYGCSCGCTPSRYYKFSSSNHDHLMHAVAEWACSYAVWGDDPFRKVDIPKEVVPIAERINNMWRGITANRIAIENLKQDKKTLQTSVELLGIDFPPSVTTKIEEIEAQIIECEAIIKNLGDSIENEIGDISDVEKEELE